MVEADVVVKRLPTLRLEALSYGFTRVLPRLEGVLHVKIAVANEQGVVIPPETYALASRTSRTCISHVFPFL